MSTLREQFLERLIREIFLKKGSGFVLKGGAAMRALLGEQRLTKDVDLDFTNPRRGADSLHNTLRRAITSAARGLPLNDLTISVPGKGELSPRWKINFQDRQGTRFHVEVEVSRDARRVPPGTVVQQRFAPIATGIVSAFWVDIYDQPTLIATKVAALLGRGAARDVYDLDLLLPAGAPAVGQIRWAVERADLHGQDPVEVLGDRLDALTWQRFQADLRDALPEHVAERIDETEWSAIRARVRHGVQPFLEAAGAARP